MKVIPFPGAAHPPKAAKMNVKPVKPAGPAETLITRTFEYSCLGCGTVTKFSGENMLFRTIEFYCNSCGQLHRAVNPAFAPTNKEKGK